MAQCKADLAQLHRSKMAQKIGYRFNFLFSKVIFANGTLSAATKLTCT